MKYLIIFIVTACGQPGYIREFPDSETQAIVERFEREIAPVGSITVEFVDRFDITIGRCTLTNHSAPHIQLLRSFWNMASHVGKEQLLYHELGHLKGLRHDLRVNTNDVPMSLMYPYHISDDNYKIYREEYVQVLRKEINE